MNKETPFENFVNNMDLGSYFRDRNNWRYLLLILIKRVILGYLIGTIIQITLKRLWASSPIRSR